MDRRVLYRGIALTAAALSLGAPIFGQDTGTLQQELAGLKAGQEAIQRQIDLQGQIDDLQKGQDEMRKQLEEIKKLLQQRPGAAAAAAAPAGPQVRNVIFDLGNNPVVGTPTATVTLVEFTDYQCPFCSRHVKNTHPQIAKEYIETGKIRFVSLDMPLENIHEDAFVAAQAAHCADDQGKYWEMHDRLFENPRAIRPLDSHAEAIGLDVEPFNTCISSEKYAAAVRKDMAEAKKAGASGTPSFVVAKTDPSDPTKVTGIAFLRGAKAFEAFKTELDRALEEAGE